MTAERTVAGRVASMATAVAAVAAIAAVGTALWLLGNYRPAVSWIDAAPRPGAVSTSQDWSSWQVATVLVALSASVVTAAAAVARRAWFRAAAGAVATTGLVVVLATIPLLRWNQLALWAVTVGTDITGYGVAAFDDRVRFVLVDDQEVTPAQYTVALVAHLVGHAIAVAGIAVGAVLQLRGRRSSSSSR